MGNTAESDLGGKILYKAPETHDHQNKTGSNYTG